MIIFLDKILGRKNEIRNRIFRLLLLAAGVLSLGGLIEDMLLSDDHIMLLPMGILALAVAVAMVVNFRFHKENISLWVLGVPLVTGVLPLIYITSGGVQGGATNWFFLGMVYTFLLFDGWGLMVMLILSVGATTSVYLLGMIFPEQIHHLPSEEAVIVDSMVSVLIIGLVMGGIIRFQLYVYEQERRVTEKQKKQLEESGRAKNLFFAKISHEIRTPINTVIGLNEMNLREQLPLEVMENSIAMQKAAVSLLGLINELLDLSQIETSRMSLFEEPYETKRMICNLVDMVSMRARNKHLNFQVEVDPNLPSRLKGDEKRISQVLVNLLTNAVKYTEQGMIFFEVGLETISEKELWLEASVRDSGIGIKKEDIPHLFEYYTRMDQQKTHNIEGSGLGLSITRQLVELMHGEITVDSIYRKGSTFKVRLRQEVIDPEPVGSIDFAGRIRGRAQMMQGRPGKVYVPKFEAPEARLLIVDDAKANIEVLKKLLRSTRVRIDGALDYEEALASTSKHYYHLIFLDYMMPGMNGAEILQAIRQQEDGLCRETPVVCLTGTAKTDSGEREMGFGFDGYLQKPVRGELLEGTVLRFIPDEVVEFVRESENKQAEEAMMAQLVVNRLSSHRRKRVCITTNCLSDLSPRRAEQFGVRMIFSYIETKQGRFVDTLEIDGKNVKNYLSYTESAAKAISPSVEDYENFFADTLEQAENVIHISVADNIGDSYRNALVAAGSFDHVKVVNSGLLSGGLGLLVISAARMARRGMNSEEILVELEELERKITGTFLAPTISVLGKSGYAGNMLRVLGERTRVHPFFYVRKSGIHFKGFKIGAFDVARRHYIRSVFRFRRKVDTDIVYITHVSSSIRELDSIVREIRRYVNFDQVVVERCCVACAVNAGLGTIGIAFMKK